MPKRQTLNSKSTNTGVTDKEQALTLFSDHVARAVEVGGSELRVCRIPGVGILETEVCPLPKNTSLGVTGAGIRLSRATARHHCERDCF